VSVEVVKGVGTRRGVRGRGAGRFLVGASEASTRFFWPRPLKQWFPLRGRLCAWSSPARAMARLKSC